MNRRHTTTHAHKQFKLRRELHKVVPFVDQPAALSPVAHMLAAFTAAGLTRLKPSFFGLPFHTQTADQPRNPLVNPVAPGKRAILPMSNQSQTTLRHAA